MPVKPVSEWAINNGSQTGESLVPSLVKAASAEVERSPAPVKDTNRVPALDFTKGALVLIMVLYHWMNYFIIANGSVYKYLRFLTPSFIFITGFLISNVYRAKYDIGGMRVASRLVTRGLKLIGIVLVLNVLENSVLVKGFEIRKVSEVSSGRALLSYLTGTSPVAFAVLIPIAYLLIFSAGLLPAAKAHRSVLNIVCAITVACALVSDLMSLQSGYLQIFSLGMLGVSTGCIAITRINNVVRHVSPVIAAYVLYLMALTWWNDSYALQVPGVCLSLAIIYRLGLENTAPPRIYSLVVLLGRYSLFAYIVQIVILQILRKTLRPFGLGADVGITAFFAAATLTIISVGLTDYARRRVSGVNRLYNVVFS